MKTLTLCLTFAGLSLLTACQSTTKSQSTKSAEINQQTQYFAEAKISLDKLKEDISQGRIDKLGYYAPATFKQAVSQFDEATEEYMDIAKNGASALNVFQSETEQYKQAKQEIIHHIALANQKLKFSYSIKETAETTLAESFAHRDFLIAIGAPKIYGKTYKKLSKRVDDLVEYIDEGKVSKAQEKQPQLLADMHALEVLTVRQTALGQLDKDIAYIKKKRLAKYVPISHEQLITARNNANAILTATPRASDEIITAVAQAEFELAHLYHTAKEVNTLRKIKTKDYEQYLLAKETQLHSISEALGIDDVRDMAIAKQVETIAMQAGTIKDKLTTANAAVLALQSDNTQSSATTESLRAEFKNQLVDLNAKYDALVIENSTLNKQLQSKDIELVRLQAYKEAVIEVEGKHAAETQRKIAQEKAAALEAQAKQEAKAAAEVNAPVEPAAQPVAQVSAPAEPATQPVAQVSAPAEPAAQPAAQVSAPAEPAAQPAAQVSAPAEPAAQPAAQVNAPAAQVSAPAEPAAQPAAQVSTPAEPVAQPADQVSAPAEPAAQPAAQVSAPAEPAAQPAAPVGAPAEPANALSEQAKQAAEVKAPLEG